jgi:hypothetical protein
MLKIKIKRMCKFGKLITDTYVKGVEVGVGESIESAPPM